LDYWNILGIDATDDKKAVKRAYSKKLKITRPDDDAAGYQALREAFDWAIKYGVYYHSDESAVDEPDLVDESDYVDENPAQPDDYDWGDLVEPQFEVTDQPTAPHFKIAQDAVDELFVLSSEDEMIDLFDSWLITGELSNLKVRDAFSDMCFERAVNSAAEGSSGATASVKYPVRLYRHMANEFDWLTTLQTDYYRATNQANLQLRFDCYARYQELEHSLGEPWYTGLLDADYWRAKFLLGPLYTILFVVISRIGVFNFLIRNGIKDFEQARSFQLIPEIETPSFVWWEAFLSKPRLSILHIVYGYFFAQALYYEPKISSLIGLDPWGLQILCLIFGALLSYALSVIYFKVSHLGGYSNSTKYFWYGMLAVLTGLIFIFEGEISLFVCNMAILVCVWKLIGFAGYIHMIAIMALSTIAIGTFRFNDVENWEYVFGFLAVTNYFVFNLVLPYLPNWIINATMRTGFPHIVVVSTTTGISVALISYLQGLV
jgi:hypothetical protein